MSVFVVAEAGCNHAGDRAKMLALCDAAKQAGADAVKFQAYSMEKLVQRRKMTDMDAIELLRRSQLTDDDLDAIAAHCKKIGIKWFASVFNPSQIERVLSRGACALKIGHAEADWAELIRACYAALGPGGPVWISNGPLGNVVCSAAYPADGTPPRLGGIDNEGGYWRGFSSHYTDYHIPAAAALRGAEYIEAHLCVGDTDEPEFIWSLDPFEFEKMVKLIREYETWL
jgi:sialic acid synthase SpsE